MCLDFKAAFEKGNIFASGVAVDDDASILVAKEGDAKTQVTVLTIAPQAQNPMGHQNSL
jgi:hypothetical protein